MKKQKGMKRYEELEFKDDFMFGKVMEDLELCHDVLECLLGRPVGKLMELLLFTVTIPRGIFMRFLHENPGQWARNMTDRAYFCAFCCYEQRSCE